MSRIFRYNINIQYLYKLRLNMNTPALLCTIHDTRYDIEHSVAKDISSAQCKEVTGSRDVLWINEDIGQWTLPWRISEIFLQYCISLTAYCYKKGEARKDIQLTPKKLHFRINPVLPISINISSRQW